MPLTTDDVIEIQMLYARYNTAIDTGDGATFGGLFVPDGVFNPGHMLCEGQEAIAEFGAKTHEMMPLMRHNATNIVIDGEGDSATGSAFLIGYIAGADHMIAGDQNDTFAGAIVDFLTRRVPPTRSAETR